LKLFSERLYLKREARSGTILRDKTGENGKFVQTSNLTGSAYRRIIVEGINELSSVTLRLIAKAHYQRRCMRLIPA